MAFTITGNLVIEVVLRVKLWLLYILFDSFEPYMRVIRPEEIGMYKYPTIPSIVPSAYLWFLIFALPITMFAANYYIQKNAKDVEDSLLCLSLIYGLTGVCVTFLKVIVGRPRPDYYERCQPECMKNDYSACSGDRKMIMDGRKSFPSGHASFAFSSMVFTSLYFAGKLKLLREDERIVAWKLLVCIFPLFVATFVAVSRTCDYHHHWQDVVCGAMLGAVLSYNCYRFYFPAVSREMSHLSYEAQKVKEEFEEADIVHTDVPLKSADK